MVTYNSTANWGSSQFIVSATAGAGSYTTIQTALTAAAAAGGGLVLVEGGNYTENLTIPASVVVCNASSVATSISGNANVLITGEHTFNLTGTGSSAFVGIVLQSSANTSMISVSSSGGTATLRFLSCVLTATVSNAIEVFSGGNVQFSLNSSTTGATAAVIITGTGVLSANNSNFFSGGASAAVILSIGTGDIGLTYCGVFLNSPATGAAVALTSTGKLFSRYCTFQTASTSTSNIITVAAGSQFSTNLDTFITAASRTYYVSGTGSIVYSSSVVQSPDGETLDPGLTKVLSVFDIASFTRQNATTVRQIEAAGAANTFGVATLVNGTVTISTTAIQSTSRLLFSNQNQNGSTALGQYVLGTVVAGTSFVINALNVTTGGTVQTGDQSTIYWQIIGST